MKFLAAENGEVLEMLEKQDPMLEKAVKRLVYVSADEKLRYEMAMREKAELDYYSDMQDSYDKGLSEGLSEGYSDGMNEGMTKGIAEGMTKGIAEGMTKGIAEGMTKGIAEGIAKSNADIIRNMKAAKLSIDDIARLTRLSKAEIEKHYHTDENQ